MFGLDEATFGVVAVGLFMQICGFLQMPFLLGPSFSPFTMLIALPEQWFQKLPKAEVNLLPEGTPSAAAVTVSTAGSNGSTGSAVTTPHKSKRRRNRNKKKEL